MTDHNHIIPSEPADEGARRLRSRRWRYGDRVRSARQRNKRSGVIVGMHGIWVTVAWDHGIISREYAREMRLIEPRDGSPVDQDERPA